MCILLLLAGLSCVHLQSKTFTNSMDSHLTLVQNILHASSFSSYWEPRGFYQKKLDRLVQVDIKCNTIKFYHFLLSDNRSVFHFLGYTRNDALGKKVAINSKWGTLGCFRQMQKFLRWSQCILKIIFTFGTIFGFIEKFDTGIQLKMGEAFVERIVPTFNLNWMPRPRNNRYSFIIILNLSITLPWANFSNEKYFPWQNSWFVIC